MLASAPLILLATLGNPATAAPNHASAAKGRTEAGERGIPSGSADWRAMVRRVNERLRRRAEQAGIPSAPAASDAELLRRLSLDLTGRIPDVSEVRQWLADSREDRRERLVERLLQSPRHASFWAGIWRQVLVPDRMDPRRLNAASRLEMWLRDQLRENRPYNEMVDQLLVGGDEQGADPSAIYYSSFEYQPQELAANISRGLLGVQIQCAECHDHPFEHWTRRDFWAMAAFFARLEPPSRQFGFSGFEPVRETDEGELTLPGTDEVVAPAFLDGQGVVAADQSRRRQLAAWLTGDDNPYFARAAVNRVWGHFFGRGLVEPVDDLGGHNPGLHPGLLEELAEFFVESGYDPRSLIRVVVHSEAYRLSSGGEESDVRQTDFFRRMSVRPLSAEQLYDSLETAVMRPTAMPGYGFVPRPLPSNDRRAFLARFGEGRETGTEYQAGIPQALTLMNGSLVRNGTDLEKSPRLRSLKAPFWDDEQRIDILFLATLSRPPRPEEQRQFREYLAPCKSEDERGRAFSDMLWALLNSAEFSLNH